MLIAAGLVLLLTAPSSPRAATVDFTGNGDGKMDNTASLKAAIRKAGSGGTVRLPKAANCFALNAAVPFEGSSVAVVLPPNITLQGSDTKFCSANPDQGYLFGSLAGNFKIDGVTFEGTQALMVSGGHNPDHHFVSNITLTHDVFENITSMNPQGAAVVLYGQVRKLTFDSNKVQNIWQGGFDANSTNLSVLFPNNGPGGGPCYNSQDGQLCDVGRGGVLVIGGCSYCAFTHNVFQKIQSNGLSINVRPEQLSTAYHVDAPGLVIADNEFVRIHRMSIEIGGFGTCIGECDFTVVPFTGPVIERNFVHHPQMPYWHSFGLSIVFNGSTDAVFRNNSVVNENTTNCYGGTVGQAFEHAANSLNFIGNVVSSLRAPCEKLHGWNGNVILGGINTNIPQGLAIYQNNKICGPDVGDIGIGKETQAVPMRTQYNYAANTCPEGQAIATSKMSISFTTPANRVSGSGPGSVSVGVKSTLSVAQVEFFLDDSSAAFAVQKTNDISPTFSSDLLWLYHGQLPANQAVSGPHKVRVVATDVAGGRQEKTQTVSF